MYPSFDMWIIYLNKGKANHKENFCGEELTLD
jgi:hypothetical protein